MTKNTGRNEAVQKKAERRYTKEQLQGAAENAATRDILAAVLDGGKTYTKDQAKDLAGKYLKGKV